MRPIPHYRLAAFAATWCTTILTGVSDCHPYLMWIALGLHFVSTWRLVSVLP